MKALKTQQIAVILVLSVILSTFAAVTPVSAVHIAKLNGRICGAKRSHSVFEQPNCYQSV